MQDALIPYLKDIGRGKDGARPMTREQACHAWSLLLNGDTDALTTGAFLMAMRIKGETPQEMAGFLDATHAALQYPDWPQDERLTVVIPSYNGARKLPLLTPLLAHLLARQGLRVLLHGMATEERRVSVPQVLEPLRALLPVSDQDPVWIDTATLHPGLARLLDARRQMGLRNSAHSLVKLMNPCPTGRSLVLGSYTHPEYALSMAATVAVMQGHALLLRGTEGEVVADARRQPRMEGLVRGQRVWLSEAQSGSLATLPELPDGTDPQATAQYIADVLADRLPAPEPIRQQVKIILQLAAQVDA